MLFVQHLPKHSLTVQCFICFTAHTALSSPLHPAKQRPQLLSGGFSCQLSAGLLTARLLIMSAMFLIRTYTVCVALLNLSKPDSQSMQLGPLKPLICKCAFGLTHVRLLSLKMSLSFLINIKDLPKGDVMSVRLIKSSVCPPPDSADQLPAQ